MTLEKLLPDQLLEQVIPRGPLELPYLSSTGGELRTNLCVMAEQISYVTEISNRFAYPTELQE
ncbi:hypothetical protein COLO4_03022 [Corchorus olitorius]|uniref:Uncharacterized protein n=1 Tax=Corchorus olitorius TaxID=93759 RepID=A0A1R3KZP3_9ROSI|nr:hypothetical protein COLO4_04198 [Corchorus olitorius]OMP12562.1 hypothetical protein COLO4_03022 [Corchorus olitorius]